MAEFPSMPLFCDAYRGDTMHLSLEEHGAYMLLLMTMWTNRGSIPDDDRDNARRLGISQRRWTAIKGRLSPFLTFYGPANDRKITQIRLQDEWNKVCEFRAKQSEKGKAGSDSRWKRKQALSNSHGHSPVNAPANGTGNGRKDGRNHGRPIAPISNKEDITNSSTPSPREAPADSPQAEKTELPSSDDQPTTPLRAGASRSVRPRETGASYLLQTNLMKGTA